MRAGWGLVCRDKQSCTAPCVLLLLRLNERETGDAVPDGNTGVLLQTLTNTSWPSGFIWTGMLEESCRSCRSWASAPCWPGLERLILLSDLLFVGFLRQLGPAGIERTNLSRFYFLGAEKKSGSP